jgi:lipopolysaccharide/colanic/teichoic acid biosynthesis glycosyltransferase
MNRIMAAAGLFCLAPIFVLIAIAIWVEDGAPVIFRQVRVGKSGKPFWVLKFRSMRSGLRGARITAASDRRVTRTGRLLRKFKLDELPQLWNVLRGEMAFVGPRPEIPYYVDASNPLWCQVLSVKPGITDLATLAYRDEEQMLAAFDDPEKGYVEQILPTKLALNLAYLDRRTLLTDLKLIGLTLRYSFLRTSVSAAYLKKLVLS